MERARHQLTPAMSMQQIVHRAVTGRVPNRPFVSCLASDVRILIVDACRDNEAVQQVASRLPASRAAAVSRGLSRVPDADGTLVVFATQPNRVAADGAGRNSPFTQALLKHLPTPGVELRTLMTRVRADVVAATGGMQRPELSDSLVGEFVFKAGP
jgi:uncharacterized caspase-like protein